MKKKIYISIPITGKDIDKVMCDAVFAKMKLQSKEVECVCPFDICDEKNKPYSYYMGKDIEVLLECEAIYLCQGWQNSKGCMTEFEVARIYGKEIIFE
jgi:hypothetical protein